MLSLATLIVTVSLVADSQPYLYFPMGVACCVRNIWIVKADLGLLGLINVAAGGREIGKPAVALGFEDREACKSTPVQCNEVHRGIVGSFSSIRGPDKDPK